MFVITLGRSNLRRMGIGAMCCTVMVLCMVLGRYISNRAVLAAAPVMNRIETTQDIQTWFTGYGIEVELTSITADKVKIPRHWDDSFSAFNAIVQQSGMDLARYKGKTVEKWMALIPAQSTGQTSCYGVLLLYRKKPVGAYLLEKPTGTVKGLTEAQSNQTEQASPSQSAAQTLSENAENTQANPAPEPPAQQTAGQPEDAAVFVELPLDAEGYPVE